ncbi:hypothetical protein BSL78_28003, partial [Apostichopus japonicus]
MDRNPNPTQNAALPMSASCQTVVTYSSKSSEELLCPITEQTLTATWADETSMNTLFTYVRGQPDIEIVAPGSKHINFMPNVSATSFSLIIQDVQAEDGGVYVCITAGGGTIRNEHTVFVEVLAKPTVQYESQVVDVLDVIVGTLYDLTCSAAGARNKFSSFKKWLKISSYVKLVKCLLIQQSRKDHKIVDDLDVIVGTSYDLTCSATGARSVSDLSLVWDPSLEENTPNITSNGDLKDYSITSTYTAVRGVSSITCQLTGYVMQDEINDLRMENISHTVNLNVRSSKTTKEQSPTNGDMSI